MISNAETYYTYCMPHGPITIQANAKGITRIVFGRAILSGTKCPNALTTQTANELLEYFAGKRTVFDIALDTGGSAFQRAVWNELMLIPYATTSSAAVIAARIGKPTSYRAVGTAINKNPLSIVIPDHRVVGTNGHTTKGDATTRIKSALLAMEKKYTV